MNNKYTMMTKKILLFLTAIFCAFTYVSAQSKAVSIGKVTSESSAILDVASSDFSKTGSGATATATVSNGQVTAITVTNGGSGYVSPVEVNIFATGSDFDTAYGARATATIVDGVVTAVTVTDGGTGYVSGTTSVSINPGNKAVVLPRVDLVSITNGTTPVSSPKDGLHVFNNPTNITSGIYFWNSSVPKWDRAIPFIETPKGGLITYSGTNTYILDNALNGSFVPLSDGADDFEYNLMCRQMGLKSVRLINGSTGVQDSYYSINLEPGKYKIEVTFYLYAPTPDDARSIFINGTSGYYYMGYFVDGLLYEYDPKTLIKTDPQPTLVAPYTLLGNRYRKEYGVISKPNQLHRMTQIFDLNIPVSTSGKKYALKLNLGRMSGSGFYDRFYYDRDRSYIKVNRY